MASMGRSVYDSPMACMCHLHSAQAFRAWFGQLCKEVHIVVVETLYLRHGNSHCSLAELEKNTR